MEHHGGNIYIYDRPMLDFSANINPLGMPPGVESALRKSIAACVHYPDPKCTTLREALAKKHHVATEHILCGNGAADLIFRLVYAFQPKTALLLAPTFSEYGAALKQVHCKIAEYSLSAERDFIVEENYLQQLREYKPDFCVICNPNNPTGQLISKGLLLRILDICQTQGTTVLLDECFMDFLREKSDYSCIDVLNEYTNLFILRAFTKFYALPGIRLGYLLSGNQAALQQVEDCGQSWSVSVPAQQAGVACLQEEAYGAKTVSYVEQQRNFLRKELEELGYSNVLGQVNYLFFKGDPMLAQYCLDHGIMIRDCNSYSGLDKGYYRIAVKTESENKQFIACLQSFRRRQQNG